MEHLDAELAGFAGLNLAAFTADRDVQVTDLPGASPLVEHRPQFLIPEGFVGAGVELVQVDGLDAQGPQGIFKLPRDARWREVVAPAEKAPELVAELGGDGPPRALLAA